VTDTTRYPGRWPSFEDFFRSATPARDKFLSRLFGLFSEDVVRHWCRCPDARYEDLGRPHLRLPGERYGHTLDFTLRHRATGRTFVAELKCELEYESYRYLRLTDPAQLTHHAGTAFQKLLAVAKEPMQIPVTVAGKALQVEGAVLVWGATTPEGCERAMDAFGFADVLSVELMLDDSPALAEGRVGQPCSRGRRMVQRADGLPRRTATGVLTLTRSRPPGVVQLPAHRRVRGHRQRLGSERPCHAWRWVPPQWRASVTC
jgi:hypothetical protein